MGNWDHGRQDLQRKKKKAERARKPEAISFLFFWLGITQKERASELYWHHRVYIKSLKFLFPVRTRRRRRAWFSRGNQRLWRSCTATSERKGAGREREERDGGHQWLPRNKTKKQTSKQSSNGQISELFFSSARVLANGHAFSFARFHVFGSGSEIKLVRTCRFDQVREFVQQVGR